MDLYKVFLYSDQPQKGNASCMVRAATIQAANLLAQAIAYSMTQIDPEDDNWFHTIEAVE